MKRLLLLLLLMLLSSGLLAAPQIQHWTTANGARAYFIATDALPIVDVQLLFDAGSARDGDQPGLALLTNGLLAEGAGGLDSNAIAERFDNVGAQFSNSSQRDGASLSLRSLADRRYLDPALETLMLVASKPDFPPGAFERERARLLVGLQSRKQSPDDLAEEALYKAIYHRHPYASEPIGEETSLVQLTPADLAAFHERYYVARNAVIAVVGDLSRAEAEAIAEQLTRDLPQGEPAAQLPAVDSLNEPATVHINHPSTQTTIQVGQVGMRRDDPDYYSLYVGNHILGGNALVSRIYNEVREKRGLAYSAYSQFIPMRMSGPFILGAQTRNESAAESLQVMLDTLQRFIDQGPTAEELAAAKKNITGSFPLRIDSNKDLVDYCAMIGFYRLPLDYLDTFNERVEAISLDDIRDAFRRRIHPGQMATITVGP